MGVGTTILRMLLCASATAIAPLQPAVGQQAQTLNEVGSALIACWSPPDGSAGMKVTVRLSLKRSGALFGEPRITYSRLGKDEKLNRAFVASVLQSLDDCTPVNLTEAMGGAVAGRPFTLRFQARKVPQPAQKVWA